MRPCTQTSRRELRELLLELFDIKDLHIFVGDYYKTIEPELPSGNPSAKHAVNAVIDALARRRWIDDALFDQLVQQFPAQRERVDALRIQLLAAPIKASSLGSATTIHHRIVLARLAVGTISSVMLFIGVSFLVSQNPPPPTLEDGVTQSVAAPPRLQRTITLIRHGDAARHQYKSDACSAEEISADKLKVDCLSSALPTKLAVIGPDPRPQCTFTLESGLNRGSLNLFPGGCLATTANGCSLDTVPTRLFESAWSKVGSAELVAALPNDTNLWKITCPTPVRAELEWNAQIDSTVALSLPPTPDEIELSGMIVRVRHTQLSLPAELARRVKQLSRVDMDISASFNCKLDREQRDYPIEIEVTGGAKFAYIPTGALCDKCQTPGKIQHIPTLLGPHQCSPGCQRRIVKTTHCEITTACECP